MILRTLSTWFPSFLLKILNPWVAQGAKVHSPCKNDFAVNDFAIPFGH